MSVMTVTKKEIADGIHQELKLPKSVCKFIVDQAFEEIRLSLESGKSVKLSGFGNFELREKKARPGRNPKTGEPKVIQARRVVTFKAGQKLKSHLQSKKAKREQSSEE